MTRWWLLLCGLLLGLGALAEDFESGFLYGWQIPGRNMPGTPPAKGAQVRLADAQRGEPVHGGRYALCVQTAEAEESVSPAGRVALADSPSRRWLVEGWVLVQRGELFTNAYHFNSDGGYCGEKQFFVRPAPGWQHFRVIIGPPDANVDVPLSKGAVSFNWPLRVRANSIVYFDDYSITPLDLNRLTVQDPAWKPADGKAAFKVQVKLVDVKDEPLPGIGGYGANWPADLQLPPVAGTPRAGVQVVLRPDRQGFEQIEPAIATTDAKGEATFTVRATRAGTVKVRAYTPAPKGKPYGDLLTAEPATLTWAEGSPTVTIEDFTGHRWADELVHYRFAWPQGEAVQVRVTDATGAVLATQLSEVEKYPNGSLASAVVSWMATVAPMQKATYTVVAQPARVRSALPPMPKTDLAVKQGDTLEVTTARIGLRLPIQARQFPAPQRANLPGPILAVRGRSGAWLGRGWLEHPEGAYRITPEVRANGPLFADYRVTYELTNGRYVVDVRVIAGSEVALITEEYDTGSGAFKFSLYDGLKPDTARWRGHTSDPNLAPSYGGGGSGKEAVSPLKYDKDGGIFGLAGWMTWWPNTGFYWGVYNSANPQSDYLGLFRRHSGQWRNPQWPNVDMAKKPDLVASFGLGAGKRLWGLYSATAAEALPTPGPADEKSGTLIGENKLIWNNGRPAASETSRAGLQRAMIKYGEMPLDKYKEWILDWPGADNDVYPRMFVAPGTLEKVRERVQNYPPAKSRLHQGSYKHFTYLVTGDAKVGREIFDGFNSGDYNWTGQANRMRADILEWLEGEGDTGGAMHNLHGQGKVRANALRYDAIAAVKELTPEERRTLRALMAFEAQKVADLDWCPFGTGFHLGNPNMPTAVAATIGLCGTALPSHPYAAEWMDRAYRYTRDTINSFTAGGGAWNECPHYQMDASLQQILQLAIALKHTGYADLSTEPKLLATMRYAAEIWTPVDARVGYRVMPSIGNGGLESTSLFGWMAALSRDSHPQFAAEQQWVWQQGGELLMYPFDELVIDPTAEAKAPSFHSANFPGFGAILRSGGTQPNETYLSFRAGYWTSHYEPGDQGSLILYAKGAPLCLDFGSQYAPMVGRPFMHNRVSFDHKYSVDNGGITTFASSGQADYARSRVSTTTLMELPETPEEEQRLRDQRILLPNTMPPTKTVPQLAWDRQVVYPKDADPLAPNYFVLRESFSGNTTLPTDWSLWTLANAVTWDGNHGVAAAQYGNVLLDVFSLEPAQPRWATGEWAHQFLPGMSHAGWQRQNPGKPFEERQKLLRLAQEPGQGYLVVLYPRLATEAAPQVTALPNGGGAKVVHPQGTDLVFVSPTALETTVEGIRFAGTAATVRQRKDRFTLALLDGTALALEGKLGINQPGGGSVTVTVAAKTLTIETDGKARQVHLTVPAAWAQATLPADSPLKLTDRQDTTWTLDLPAGPARVTVAP